MPSYFETEIEINLVVTVKGYYSKGEAPNHYDPGIDPEIDLETISIVDETEAEVDITNYLPYETIEDIRDRALDIMDND